jgi:hypothetical protein
MLSDKEQRRIWMLLVFGLVIPVVVSAGVALTTL